MPYQRSSDLPGTIQRSPAKAQRTFAKTLQSAEKEYGPGRRASQTAYAALKHSFEKVGDHWEPKAQPGPSDSRAKQSVAGKRPSKGETFGGVDVEGHTRDELQQRAKSLGIKGYSSMTKAELGRAIAKKQD
jgi:cation transport regulator ChaB